MRWLPALVLVGLLVGCRGGSAASSDPASAVPSVSPMPTVIPPGTSPVPRMLSPADDGGVYTMQVGQTSGLVVPDPMAPDPEVEGDSVEVVAISNVGASGQREWELRAVTAGRTILRAAGATPYTITLDVE